ncbi:ABC transporter ATP-binding protein [Peptostreptococcus anaerobius]|uniref:ABC transporter, ATP-binding protein n=1 Tax=Peptostreptococcus anaerobius 653-L TaxID=596329 RepID=D3MRT9_9FIRM|nr:MULTISPECIES: ABC transporter ATP-binding protein [Peptostreptococcus]EFD05148.1 ABC transporter, ATP-binding protein [Peptostreptococcus anaerobius 653-L]MDB8820760.1 ABC transporter ATP-binding protein [Peptostreptococcus anaerobius]MDB8825239.1 ABC transporter ATP-binding protein [Peptostreptococcus anaerobius]MDB8827072.1 ABC transporter ATP-binding protein [Peptostreptococcus anaerobius]MDB8829075.1 ABC transporter ATP-binding protein [Peptostreptococcus anaerobius]
MKFHSFISDIRLIYRYILKLKFSRLSICNIIAIITLESSLLMLEPFYFGKVIDGLTHKNAVLVKYVFILILIFIGTTILFKIKTMCLIKITTDIEKKVKLDVFSQVFKIQYKDFLRIDKGTLLNNIEEDSMVISNLFNDLIDFFRCLATVIVTFMIMLKINVLLTLIVICFLPVEFILFVIMGQLLRVKIRKLSQLKDEYINVINESFNGFKTIKLLGVQNERKKHFADETNNIYRLGVNKANLDVNVSLTISIISFISRMLVIVIGGKLCLEGSISIGTLVAFSTYSEKFKVEGSGLSSFSSMVQSIGVSLERINTLFEEHTLDLYADTEADVVEDNINDRMKIDKIEISNLDFCYITSNNIIEDFSFTFNHGKIYKINGPSGKGKSTFLDILSGLYPEKMTNIKVNDSKDYDLNSYRNSIVYIDQNSYIFTLSIYDNISMYRDIELDSVKKICIKLGIDEVVENLPNKYYTIINSEINLSSGQLQRILIARAFVEKKDMYIFDETTAYLDKENKVIFFEMLKKVSNDSIVIFSSHEDIGYIEVEAIDFCI